MILLLLFLFPILVICSPETIVKTVNKERSRYGLEPITYNYEIGASLDKLIPSGPFFFEQNSNSLIIQIDNFNRTNRLNGAFLTPGNFSYLFRDTFNFKIKRGVTRIFQMRINQRNCIKRKCKPYYKSHKICLKKIHIQDKQRCSYVWAYYPLIINPLLKEIACVKLKIKGLYTPDKLLNKQLSFWCYSNLKVHIFQD